MAVCGLCTPPTFSRGQHRIQRICKGADRPRCSGLAGEVQGKEGRGPFLWGAGAQQKEQGCRPGSLGHMHPNHRSWPGKEELGPCLPQLQRGTSHNPHVPTFLGAIAMLVLSSQAQR